MKVELLAIKVDISKRDMVALCVGEEDLDPLEQSDLSSSNGLVSPGVQQGQISAVERRSLR